PPLNATRRVVPCFIVIDDSAARTTTPKLSGIWRQFAIVGVSLVYCDFTTAALTTVANDTTFSRAASTSFRALSTSLGGGGGAVFPSGPAGCTLGVSGGAFGVPGTFGAGIEVG